VERDIGRRLTITGTAREFQQTMMSTRSMRTATAMSARANSTRRIRRTQHNHLYCSTNGCASFLQLDPSTGIATCPICGLTRRVH
jgi:hypothetical protein